MKSKILNYTVILQKESEGGYTVTVPSLPGCVTYGKDVEEAKKMAIEVIELYLESLKEHNVEIPEEQETFYTQVSIMPSINHA
ncbi:MAG: type II toxin-antitoxin system HicB family antitoxin [Candidatus Levyibacteriota bacterium]